MRKYVEFKIADNSSYKILLLQWISKYSSFCYLDSCNASYLELNPIYNNYDSVIGVDNANFLIIDGSGNSLKQLKDFHIQHNDWLFGFFSYELKNEIENLQSNHEDHLAFPTLHFFQPKIIFLMKENSVTIGFLPAYCTIEEIKAIHEEILKFKVQNSKFKVSDIFFAPKISREEYIEKIKIIKQHIQIGDIYEVNFCQEFFTYVNGLHPIEIYLNLKEISPAPFSAFYRLNDRYLLCASPERFLMKKGNQIISQPIKGTIKKGSTIAEDEKLKAQLQNDPKERAENIMIVDLVRNDLSKIAKKASVKVEGLCEIYSYKQVHQMISTISADMSDDIHFTDAIRSCFPMGSMTGAPKIRAMELIEKYESTKRGLFSGSVGYIAPNGDFDLNVVIRSLFYNATNNYLSFMVGSAITAKSDPEKEYEECLLKAKAMLDALDSKLKF